MKVRIVRDSDSYELGVRYTDEIGEDEGMSEQQIIEMECVLRNQGRFWLDSERILFPAHK